MYKHVPHVLSIGIGFQMFGTGSEVVVICDTWNVQHVKVQTAHDVFLPLRLGAVGFA